MMLAEILAAAARAPEAPALVTQDSQTIGFARLAGTIEVAAARLLAGGLQPGARLGVEVDNLAVRLILWLAAARIGALPVILPGLAAAEAAGLVPDIAVVLPDQRRGRPGERVFDQGWLDGPAGPLPPLPADAGLFLASSGSTGTPKAMRYPPGATAARNRHMNRAAGAPAAPVLVAISITNAGGLRYALRALAAGQAVVLPRTGPRPSLLAAVAAGAGEITAPPPLLADLAEAMAEAPVPGLHLRRIETVGSSISEALLRRVEAVFGCPVTVMYGTSEISTIAVGRPLGPGYEPGLVGPPAAGVEIRVLDAGGRALPPETPGRLAVRAVPELRVLPYLNAEGPFDAEGWFLTGDLGRLRADGALVLSGRAGHLINTGGQGHLPEEFEALALTVPGVTRAGAVALPGPEGFDHVGLGIVPGPGFSEPLLSVALAARFPLVRSFRIARLAALPLTAAGKIDRAALRRSLAGESAAGAKNDA